MKFRNRFGLVCAIGGLMLSGCNTHTVTNTALSSEKTSGTEQSSGQQTEAQEEIFAMDTYMTVTAYGEDAQNAADTAIQEIQRLDELLSTGNEKSEVRQLNEQDGVLYHHIIDPSTGYPAESGLESVTLVSEDGTLADGLSTSLFVMGKDKALEYWKQHSEAFDVILMTEEKKLYITEGIKDNFTSDFSVEVISKH